MQKTSPVRFGFSSSKNRKSKIQNRKWSWGFAIGITLALCGAVAEAQQPKKIPQIGYLSPVDAASESTRFVAFGWHCASLAT